MTTLNNDLISRKALLEELNSLETIGCSGEYLINSKVKEAITNAPTIEADSGEAVAVKITRSSDGRLLLTQPNGKYFDVNEAIGKTFYTSPQKREIK